VLHKRRRDEEERKKRGKKERMKRGSERCSLLSLKDILKFGGAYEFEDWAISFCI